MHAAAATTPNLDSPPLHSVLIVEDDEPLASVWRRWLQRRGLQVETVTTAEAALEHLTASHTDLVVLDLHLSGPASGPDVLSHLAHADGQPPVIVVSGFLDGERAARALDLGAAQLVQKPCAPAELYLRVRWLLLGGDRQHISTFMRAEFAHIRSLRQLSAVVGVHRHTIGRLVKAQFRQSPHEYMTHLRVTEAQRLLVTTDLTIAQVAGRVGFASCQGLERAFRRRVGCTPRQYRGRSPGRPEG